MFRNKRSEHGPARTPLLLIDQQAASGNDRGEVILAKGASLGEYRHHERRAEWRIRQAYFERYGRAPGPTIIQL